MRLGTEDGPAAAQAEPDRVKAHHQGCCSLNDASDARLVAAQLGVPFYVMNFKKDFGRIIDHFVDEYNRGRTPNPCIRCNNWLKFGKLDAYARSIDADCVATGHHARIDHHGGRYRLLCGVDRAKDQSYVLFGIRRAMLGRMKLPVGHFRKDQIRQMAEQMKLPVFDKPDSQEICFVPDNNYVNLIRKHSAGAMKPGRIVDHAGRMLGEHGGHQQFTVGQRRGLSLALGHPVYVVAKDAKANTVTVGTGSRTAAPGLVARQLNWLDWPPPADRWLACQAKTRSNGPAHHAHMRLQGVDELHVRFAQPQRAITPGQAVVCYDGQQVIGGGWIDRAWPLTTDGQTRTDSPPA